MNGEVGTGKPSGPENRGTVKGDGSSSLPLSAKDLWEKFKEIAQQYDFKVLMARAPDEMRTRTGRRIVPKVLFRDYESDLR